MASVNKVILVGNLGKDPELRHLPSGETVANLSLATTDSWKDKDGIKQESTEWHRVSFFGRQAEVCGQYLKKGSQIFVEGSIRTKKYTDKDGIEKFSTEVRGERMQMLGGRQGMDGDGGNSEHSVDGGSYGPRSAEGGVRTSTPIRQPASTPRVPGDIDDDIPF